MSDLWNVIRGIAATTPFALIGAVMLVALIVIGTHQQMYSLNGIKTRPVGDGQHGTARWATAKEIRATYTRVPFEPEKWRKGENLPTDKQGLILGCEGPKNNVTALVDTNDIHALVTAASGAGKTAFFLYPNIEYALASGMSFLCTDTKGDLFRNYAGIARDCYGYHIAILDLRNPTRSDGNNLLHLINKYMDVYKANPSNLAAKAKSEKYAKILAKTLINTSGGEANYGQNQFFYDAAEGLLTAMLLLVAEYLPTTDAECNPIEQRHIVSVFKLVQELVGPSKTKGKSQFQELMEKLPPNHKARWFAGSALNSAEQAMASVLSTVLSRLNAFLDSEMEQILCFETAIDAEKFCNEKSAIFVVLPEEDTTKYFMVSLIIQNLYREILTVADENGGRLKNRVVFYADELGSCPPIQSLELMFSASRSRGLMLVPIVQSITGQLQKNYGKEGSEIIVDNCQVSIFGGFAPGSQTAQELSRSLGSQTILSGSVSKGRESSQTLQMMERPLMTADELKSMPKGSFVVMKTGVHPMRVRLRLFLDWGIRFGEPYQVPEKAQRPVAYAEKKELEAAITRQTRTIRTADADEDDAKTGGITDTGEQMMGVGADRRRASRGSHVRGS